MLSRQTAFEIKTLRSCREKLVNERPKMEIVDETQRHRETSNHPRHRTEKPPQGQPANAPECKSGQTRIAGNRDSYPSRYSAIATSDEKR